MSKPLGISPPAGWTARAHPIPAALARYLAIAGRGMVVLGAAAAAAIWLISVGILVHDMVSWWAEFAVRPLQGAIEGPPPGW